MVVKIAWYSNPFQTMITLVAGSSKNGNALKEHAQKKPNLTAKSIMCQNKLNVQKLRKERPRKFLKTVPRL